MTVPAGKKSASKRRPLWAQLPARVQAEVERLADGQVVAAVNCTGGFSPGLASRLDLANGMKVFVKAMDADEWPDQAAMHRAELAVSAALPDAVPAPRLLGWSDDSHWVVLVFECIDGAEPDLRHRPAEAFQVAAALESLAHTLTPAPIKAPTDHPRLGGWTDLARDRDRLARLSALSPWASDHLILLISLEEAGLAAAQGTSLVHFDAYPHNIIRAKNRVLFADWPHARLGAPFLDLIMFASSAAAAGIDPELVVAGRWPTAETEPHVIDAVLGAHAGFCVGGSLYRGPPEFAPIVAAKRELGIAATNWLAHRLSGSRA